MKHLLSLLIIAAAFWFFIWRMNTPIGQVTNWDFFHHSVAVNNIAQGKVSLILSDISDTFTFNSYTPLFYLPFAVIHRVTDIDALTVFWWAELVYLLASVAVSFWIGKRILDSDWGGFLTGLVGLTIFESNVAYTNLFLLPQTVAATLGSLILIWFLTRQNHWFSWPILILGSLILLSLHFIIGAGFLICLAAALILPKLPKGFILLPIILLGASLILGAFTNFLVPNRPDALDFVFSTGTKLGFFYQWFGILPILLFALGIKRVPFTFLFLTLCILAISFFPFSYALKFMTLGHYFLIVVIAAGILELRSRFLAIIIVLALMANFLVNTITTLSSSYNGETNSFISTSDLAAAKYLKANFNPVKTFLISDPDTQAVLEAASGVNTQGGAFPRLDTVQTLNSMANEADPAVMREKLLSVHDTLSEQDGRDHTLFVLSGRYFLWQHFPLSQKKSSFYQVWTSQKITIMGQEKIQSLSKSPYFRLLYQDQENAILEVL